MTIPTTLFSMFAEVDVVLPGEEEIEERWKRERGVDQNGAAWLTPRMERIVDWMMLMEKP